MPIIKYPEYSVEIVVQEGTGEIANATFSATLDPMSTSNMVLLKKKNTNLKPFIWGVSKWGDSDYYYKQNTYKGISTIGSGKNTVITLTFSQPVDHFTIYFDDVAKSMPLSLTIGSQSFDSDDYQFTYSQEIAQTTFVITVNKINEVNGVEMPLMIVGVENRIALDITHRTGLKHIRTGHTYTKDKGKPAYGIISQEGALDIFDFYTEIDDLIELGLLDNKMDITVNFQENVVGKYTSDKWTEQQTNLFNVSLDDRLMDWQNIVVPKKYELELNKTAKDLFNYLQSMTDLELVLDTRTDNHLQAIQIKYYYWEESFLWEFAQKICDLSQSYIFVRNDGKIVFISQKRINELKTEKSSNPIIVPYTRIDGRPQINRLENNRIAKVNYKEFSQEFFVKSIQNINLSIYSGQGDNLSNYTDQTNGNVILPTTQISGVASSINASFNETHNEFYLINIPKDFGVRNLADYTVEYKHKFNGQGISGFEEFNFARNLEKNQSSVYNDAHFYEYNTIYEFLEQWFNKTPNGDLYDYSLKNSYASAFKTGIIESDTNITLLMIIPKDESSMTGLAKATISVNISLLCSVLVINEMENSLTFGSGSETTLELNEFIGDKTMIDNINVSEYNANQIIENFPGKQTISFRMATDTLYYKQYKYELKNPFNTYHGGVDFSSGESGVYDMYVYENYSIVDDIITLENIITDFNNVIVGKTYYTGTSNVLTTYEILQKNINPNWHFEVLANFKFYRVEDMKTLVAYDYNKGETLKVFDIIQLKTTDGKYEPKIWQISKVEHDVGGSKWLNIEAVEI